MQDKECENCTEKFKPRKAKQKYCSRTCSTSHRRHDRICQQCGVSLAGREARKRKFCSSQCSADRKYAVFIQEWLAGERDGSRGETVSNHVRRWLFEVNKNKCEKCEWSKVNTRTGRIPLTVNHINGDWRDSRRENLELICPNCHSLTHNYGALNKGYGRPGRIQGPVA